jgi:RNA methyltransferase, TrmH family
MNFFKVAFIYGMITTSHMIIGYHRQASHFLGKVSFSLSSNKYSSGASRLVTSVQNSSIKLLRSLDKKKAREEHGLILVEGFRLIIDALKESTVEPSLIVISESGQRSPLYPTFQSEYRDYQVAKKKNSSSSSSTLPSVIEVTDEVLHSISDTVHGQGIVAAFQLPQYKHFVSTSSSSLSNNKKQFPLIVLLDQISDPGNMGTLIRSAYGLGADGILAINTCDIWSPKVLRSSMGIPLRYPVLDRTWETLSQDLQTPQNWFPLSSTTSSTTISASSTNSWSSWQVIVADGSEPHHIDYSTLNYQKPTILILGSEAHGVQLSKYQSIFSKSISIISVKIPMTRALESFNVAMAGSIILAEIAKQRRN